MASARSKSPTGSRAPSGALKGSPPLSSVPVWGHGQEGEVCFILADSNVIITAILETCKYPQGGRTLVPGLHWARTA